MASTRCSSSFKRSRKSISSTRVAGRRHGFSNVRDTLEEIHKGMSKSHPCGAGFGLMGVATDGDVALCHRFAGSDAHRLGSVFNGVDREKQSEFLVRHHIDNKTDCSTCWARPPLCRRLLSRGAHALRVHGAPEPSLLRVDPKLDQYLSRDLRGAGRTQAGVSGAVRCVTAKEGVLTCDI